MKFRKKPIVVDAFQWFDNQPSVEGMDPDLNSPSGFSCNTPEGKLNISSGDWIIKGIGGEFYPCKPDVFEKIYDPIKENEDEWIKFSDEMPKLNQEIEVSFRGNDKTVKASLILGSSSSAIGLYFDSHETKEYLEARLIKGWRPIKEKRPDFGKLNNGDFIMIELKNGDKKNGFLDLFCYRLELALLNPAMNIYNFSDIIKITRINLDTKEFEEI